MRSLVTGGGGFLGGAIARRLLERGDAVRSFSRGDYPELLAQGVEAHRGDLADLDAVLRAAQGCDAVFHTAAKAEIWGPYTEFCRANVLGTKNVIEACRRHGVARLVYTSTPSVTFAGRDQAGVDESAPYPARFLAHYPKTKAEAERIVLAANSPELATVALRPHLIWGPGDNHLAPKIIERARAGKLRLVGTGGKLVDSVYIDNAADAHVLAADRLRDDSSALGPAAGKAYFISNGEPRPVADLINGILDAAGLPPVRRTVSPGVAYAVGWMLETVYGALRVKGEPAMTRFVARQLATSHWFDISAARRDLGYRPAVSIEEGMRRLKKRLSSRGTARASSWD